MRNHINTFVKSWLFLSLSLSGCGFAPRGQLAASSSLTCVEITPHLPYDAFSQALDRSLAEAHIEVLSNHGCPILEVASHRLDANTLAYSPTGQIRRQQLQYFIDYSFKTPQGDALIPLRKLSTTRERLVDNNLEHADEFEKNLLIDEMTTDLFSQIITQMQTRLDAHANQSKSIS